MREGRGKDGMKMGGKGKGNERNEGGEGEEWDKDGGKGGGEREEWDDDGGKGKGNLEE